MMVKSKKKILKAGQKKVKDHERDLQWVLGRHIASRERKP